MEATSNSNEMLDRLDLFFSGAANTSSIADFFQEHEDVLQQMLEVCGEENRTNSEAAMRGYAVYKAYATLVDKMVDGFIALDVAKERSTTTEEALATAVMEEWNNDSLTYTSTAYIAAALDYDAFCQLAADMIEMHDYSFDGMEDDDVNE